MKFVILILITSLVGACDDEKPPPGKLEDLTGQYDEICLDGIVYYRTPYALTPKFVRETTYPVRCP